MNRKEFKQKLKYLNLTQENFAELFDQGYSTVKGWKKPPLWVVYVLEYLEVSNQLNEVDNLTEKMRDLNNKVRNLDSKNKKRDKSKKVTK